MSIRRVQVLRVVVAVIAGAGICQTQTAKAGWTGLINGAGVGWGSVNVRSVTSNTNKVTTPPNITFPSTSIKAFSGYTYTTNLPAGASTNDYAKLKGLSGGVWSASTYAASGDGTDNPELENRVRINPASCASLAMDSSINLVQFQTNNGTGIITINTAGTAGTALWLRGFEYTNDMSLIPPDDPTTPQNESVEWLKTNAVWKFETLILGPFNFGYDGSCPLEIPFTLDSSNINNLVFVSDGVAKTYPFSLVCPPDMVATCGTPVNYPPVTVNGGCGQISGTWSPPNGSTFSVGTNTVTVTAADENGVTATCAFHVTVTDTNPPVTPLLSDLTLSSCAGPVTPPTPTTTDNCGGTIYGTTTNKFPLTTLGTNVVTWTFTDASGNHTSANQNIILTGLTFQGFYSPINGVGGACTNTIRTINTGSKNPVKFDMLCNGTPVTSGPAPEVKVQLWAPDCSSGTTIIDVPAIYQNNWHINWDTSGSTPGIYKVIVVFPDGTTQFVFVKLK